MQANGTDRQVRSFANSGLYELGVKVLAFTIINSATYLRNIANVNPLNSIYDHPI